MMLLLMMVVTEMLLLMMQKLLIVVLDVHIVRLGIVTIAMAKLLVLVWACGFGGADMNVLAAGIAALPI